LALPHYCPPEHVASILGLAHDGKTRSHIERYTPRLGFTRTLHILQRLGIIAAHCIGLLGECQPEGDATAAGCYHSNGAGGMRIVRRGCAQGCAGACRAAACCSELAAASSAAAAAAAASWKPAVPPGPRPKPGACAASGSRPRRGASSVGERSCSPAVKLKLRPTALRSKSPPCGGLSPACACGLLPPCSELLAGSPSAWRRTLVPWPLPPLLPLSAVPGRGGLGGGRQGGGRAEAAGAGGPGTAGRRRQVDDVAQAQPQWVIWVSLQSVSKPANSTLVKSLPNGDDCQCGLAAKQ